MQTRFAHLAMIDWLDGPFGAGPLLLAGLPALFGMAVLLYRQRERLLGPMFQYDLLRSSRNPRVIGHRFLFASFLLITLYLVFSSWFPYRAFGELFAPTAVSREIAPRFAQSFFASLTTVQFSCMILVTPGYVAGVIGAEKQRRSLDFMLTTDLTNSEIILGILGARVCNLALLLLTGVPALCMVQFLGGVEPLQILVGFVVTLLCVLSMSAMSILWSVLLPTPVEAIALSYLFLVPIEAVFGGIPIGVLLKEGVESDVLFYLVGVGGTHLSLTAAAFFMAAKDLRQAYLGTEVEASGRRSILSAEPPPPPVRRPRSEVGNHAMIWKELGFNLDLRVLLIFPVLPIALTGCAVILQIRELMPPNPGNDHALRSLGGLLVGLTFMIAAVGGCNKFSRERERHTLDSLLTTPLSNVEIVLAKWLAGLRPAGFLAVPVLAIWLIGAAIGTMHFVAVPLASAAFFVYFACLSTLGLWLSFRCSTTSQATVWTLILSLLIVIGPGTLVEAFLPTPITLKEPQPPASYEILVHYVLTPMNALLTLSFSGAELRRDPYLMLRLTGALIGLIPYALATVVMWVSMLRSLRGVSGQAKGEPIASVSAR